MIHPLVKLIRRPDKTVNNRQRYLLLFCLIFPGAALAAPLDVFVTVPALVTFVNQIGGERVGVTSMIKPGQNPHSFSPTPRQITALAKASLYLKSGDFFERAWMSRIRSTNPGMRVVNLVPQATALEGGEDPKRSDEHDSHNHDNEQDHHSDEDHSHDHNDGDDPHFWTNPKHAVAISEAIARALIGVDPANTALYTTNLDRVTKSLSSLDSLIRQKLSGMAGAHFLVVHPAWGHFAEAYGLIQIAIEDEGKSPGSRAMASFVELARREGIRVIVTQPQFSQQSAKSLARAIDGEIVTVDPLSLDYEQTLLKMADLIVQGRR